MPEGDTVFLAATRLRAALAGAELTRTDFRVPRFATVDLSGRRVLEVVPRGKHLLTRIEGDVTLHTHLGMEGEWQILRSGGRWRGPDFQVRVVLETSEWAVAGFRLATTELVETEREHEIVGHLGPDPLGPDWDPAEVVRRMSKHPERPISEVITDQEVIAGPGNVYKSEVCFLRGLHPLTPVADVGDLDGLASLIKRVMDANRTTGRQVTTGDLRRGRGHWVYGRRAEPCRRCGMPIEKAEQPGPHGVRVTYWCPHCQPLQTSSNAPSGVR